MKRDQRMFLAAVAVGASLLVAPAIAQQSKGAAPTKDNPLRFTAFAVNMQGGRANVVDIVVERWSTDAERNMLIGLVKTSTDKPHGQDKLFDALEGIKPRVGYIRTPNSLGYDLKYAHENQLPDGGRQLVIATDKPVSFVAVRSAARTLDYPFTLIEMRFPAGSKEGEGKLLSQTSIAVKDGRLQLEIYGREPTRLTTIKQK